MKIVLLGYMGSGKSAMGRIVSSAFSMRGIDLDSYIEKVEGMSVPDIFRQYGEGGFRQIESFHLHTLMENDEDFVLSLGGGTPCFCGNMDYIKGKGVSVYLCASPIVLAQRLAVSSNPRPLIQGKTGDELLEYVHQSLSQREQFYSKADHVFSVETLSIEESGRLLVDMIKNEILINNK
ncbi:MAG: shikimate kinase [Flavobacteriales bacterium]|nr:shikimate kinase [Flavobacteriales bacterium]